MPNCAESRSCLRGGILTLVHLTTQRHCNVNLMQKELEIRVSAAEALSARNAYLRTQPSKPTAVRCQSKLVDNDRRSFQNLTLSNCFLKLSVMASDADSKIKLELLKFTNSQSKSISCTRLWAANTELAARDCEHISF